MLARYMLSPLNSILRFVLDLHKSNCYATVSKILTDISWRAVCFSGFRSKIILQIKLSLQILNVGN